MNPESLSPKTVFLIPLISLAVVGCGGAPTEPAETVAAPESPADPPPADETEPPQEEPAEPVEVADLPEPEDGEAYSISEVMWLAHKSGLYKDVRTGNATAKAKAQLVTLYTDLNAAEPPEGDLDAWRDRTGSLLEAAKALAASESEPPADATRQLNRWVNCNGCHNRHRS
ncbi:MAG: hypothetical protein AAF532_15110 [Planctomycetota bacterium]